MTISDVKRNGRVKQETRLYSPFDPEQALTIKAEAKLTRQYSQTATYFQPVQYLNRIFPTASDELLREYGWRIYEDMAQDAMIAGILADIVHGVVIERPRAKPNDYSELSVRMAEFVNFQFDLLEARAGISLIELFRSILRASLVYGHSVSEIVYQSDAAVDVFGVKFQADAMFTLSTLAPMLPWRYSFAVATTGELIGVVPYYYGSASAPIGFVRTGSVISDPAIIPRVKLFHVVLNRIGLDPTGESMLLPAFKPWAIKKEIEEQMVRLAKRWRKSWLGYLPPDAQDICITDPQTGQQEYIRPREDLLEVLKALANGDGGVVPAGAKIESFDVEVNAVAQYLLEAHKLMNREILRALYSRMLANNNDAAASTTGEFDQDMTAKRVVLLRAWFEDSLRQLAKAVIAVNFGEAVAALHAPKVAIGRGDGTPLSIQDVALLHQAGWFTRGQKRAVDEMLGIPPAEDDEQFVPQTQQTQQTKQTQEERFNT